MTARATASIWVALWAVAFAIAGYWFAQWIGASYLADGSVVPVSYDSFYHARRILDATGNLGAYYEFDGRIHAPDGMWVSWPWAYDWLLALYATLTRGFFGGDAIRAVAWVPVMGMGASLAVLASIARELRLSIAAGAFVLIGFASLPLIDFLYQVGALDHHWAEALTTLLATWLMLRWSVATHEVGRAVAVGVVLGLGNGVHNGLFVLQIPVLLTLAVWWWRGEAVPRVAARGFAIALVVSTLSMVIPSAAWRAGFYEFYLLSWFHLHVAVASTVFAYLFSRVRFSSGALAGLAVLAFAVAWPLLTRVHRGLDFVDGELDYLRDIVEAMSFPEFIARQGWAEFFITYSWLPLALPLMAWGLWLRARQAPRQMLVLALFLAFGAAMFAAQMRFSYYAAGAMLVAMAITIEAVPWGRDRQWFVPVIAPALLLVLIANGLPMHASVLPPGGDTAYAVSRPVLRALNELCKQQPGVVLAERGFGHFITYATDCGTVADNFIMSEADIAALDRQQHLLTLDPDALRAQAPEVRYLMLTMPDWAIEGLIKGQSINAAQEPRVLVRDLLLLRREYPGVRFVGGVMGEGLPQGAPPMIALFEITPKP